MLPFGIPALSKAWAKNADAANGVSSGVLITVEFPVANEQASYLPIIDKG